MYVVMYLIYVWIIKHEKRTCLKLSLVMMFGIIVNAVYPFMANVVPELFYKLIGVSFLPYCWLFLFGDMLSEYDEQITPVLSKYWHLLIRVAVLYISFLALILEDIQLFLMLYWDA